MSTTINYVNLLSACLSAAQQAAHVIVDTLAAGNNQSILNKKADAFDPQTIADIGAQLIIQTGLEKTFPGIQIVGEEPQSSITQNLDSLVQMPRDLTLSQNLLTTTPTVLTYLDNNANNDANAMPVISTAFLPPLFENLEVKRLIVFIDPLDGTTEYTRGRKEHVTTLISLTYDGTAIGGVLYYPFTGEAIFGGLGLGCYSTATLKLRPATIHTQHEAIANHPVFGPVCHDWLISTQESAAAAAVAIDSAPGAATGHGMWTEKHRIVTSKSHMSQHILLYFEQIGVDFNTEVTSIGGAGNKGAQVLKGAAEAYLYPSAGTSRWDIGVLEGLFFAHGGRFTDKYGDLYNYGFDETGNARGCICTMGVKHDKYLIAKPAPQVAQL